MTLDASLIHAFAPASRLRASINLGNPVLANRNGAGGAPGGVSVDLATRLAERLNVPLELVAFETASKSVEAVTSDEADIGFFAIDPLRGAGISFTAPYVLIEGVFLVRDASPVRANADVDVASNRVIVGRGSAYDLFLTRELKHAGIVRAESSQTVVETFLRDEIEVAAGVRQQLQLDTAGRSGLRLLDERFMVIQQAMGVPKSRGDNAAAFLRAYVEDQKRSGFVAAALARHGINGASVAPAA